jgi:hypothetical protein
MLYKILDGIYKNMSKLEQYRNNTKIVLEAVKTNGLALQYASNSFKDNKIIVSIAVQNNGLALKYASTRLKDDPDIVLKAVKREGSALKHASPRLRDNEEIVLAAVNNNGAALEYISQRLTVNEEIVLTGLKKYDFNMDDNTIIYNLSYELKKNKHFMLNLLTTVGMHHDMYFDNFISKQLSNDKDFILKAVQIDGNALFLGSSQLLDDTDFLINCIIANNNIINDNIIERCFHTEDTYNLFELIHNLEHHYETEYIVLDELFLNNLNYIVKTKHFEDILQYILTNQREIFLNNFNKFSNIILNNAKYLELCKDNNILLMSKEEITGFGDYNFDEVQKYYEEKFKNYTILWF